MTTTCLSFSEYSPWGQCTMHGSVCSGLVLRRLSWRVWPSPPLGKLQWCASRAVPSVWSRPSAPRWWNSHQSLRREPQGSRHLGSEVEKEEKKLRRRTGLICWTSYNMTWIFMKVRLLPCTLKYMGSTLCLTAWAFPTSSSTDETFSGSWRFSTTVLMAFMTRHACFRNWELLSISSGSSMSRNWLKYCFADGKFTKNLEKKEGQTHWEISSTGYTGIWLVQSKHEKCALS